MPGAERQTTTMLLWSYLVRQWRCWRAYRQTYNELMRLDDRGLADINLTRAEIDNVAHQTAPCG